jgi:type IV pilus assembly protein PilB
LRPIVAAIPGGNEETPRVNRFVPKDGRQPASGADDARGGELSLLSLPGVGRSKAQTLINAGFHSLRQVAESAIGDLEQVPGLGRKTAALLRDAAQRALMETDRDRPRPTVVPLPRSGPPAPEHPEDVEAEVAAPARPPANEPAQEIPAPAAGEASRDTRGQSSLEGAVETEREASGGPEAAGPAEYRGAGGGLEPRFSLGDFISGGGGSQQAPAAPPATGDPSELPGDIGAEPLATGDPAEPPGDIGAEPPEPAEPKSLDSLRAGDAEPLDVHLTVHVHNALLADFDPQLAREFEVVPVQRLGDTILVASESRLDADQLAELSRRAGVQVRAIPSQVANIAATLRTLYENNTLRSRSKGLGEILIDLGLLTPQQLGQALAHQMRENNPFFKPVLSIDPALLLLFPESLARKFNAMPIYKAGDSLLLATSEHLADSALSEIKKQTGLSATTVIVGPSELHEAMTASYQVRQRYELRQMWLGEILISRGLISREELDTCLAAQSQSRKKLGQLLVDSGFIGEDALYPILAEKLGMEYRRFEHQDVDHQLTYLVSERFADRNLILPLRLDHDAEVLEVAISDPTNLQVRDMLDSVAEAQGAELKLVLAGPSRLRDSIRYAYNFNKQMEIDLEDLEIETDVDWEEGLDGRSEITITEDLPKMRRILNKLLYEAVTEGASDIHVENLETRTQVRFRIDGILHERTTPINKNNIQKIISVLKIDSGLNIAERRRAQDGVFKMRIGKDRNIDFRINVHATQFGEDAVIRVLDRDRNLLGLSDLGFAPGVEARYESMLDNPQGLILITGPTGSGKTTTLYSSLAHLNTGDKKIVTAEDPVEYHMDGVTQYQVNNFIGNTFAEYTRRFLRKDPDVILVGEIRDDETAIACMRAAMTGHLVFSTLHTNDAVAVVQRLRDLSVDSSSIADAILCVIQQRLARRNCPDCRKPYTPDASLLREFYPTGELPPEARFVHGTGCTTCHGKGLRGRIGLYEFWAMKRATRQLISAGADENEIRRSAVEHGLSALVEDALRKVYDGLTTLEELRRVVPVEQIRTHSGYYQSQQ